MMNIVFTVAIPVYNGEKRITKVLEALKSQIPLVESTWEVIVIDNNSTDGTADIVQDFRSAWPDNVPLRYFLESQQGIAFARQRAIDESQGELVGFLDDDNWPEPSWVQAAVNFAQSHPDAGAFGGRIHASFDQEPPKNFGRIQSFFAIRDRGNISSLYRPQKLELPPGAGLVVRRQAWIDVVPPKLQNQSRGGNDFEVLLYLHRAGWKIWYAPSLVIRHHINSERLEKKSVNLLIRKASLCVCNLRMINSSPLERPMLLIRLFLGGFKRALRHMLYHRLEVIKDPMLFHEFTFYVYSSLSPLHWLFDKKVVKK